MKEDTTIKQDTEKTRPALEEIVEGPVIGIDKAVQTPTPSKLMEWVVRARVPVKP